MKYTHEKFKPKQAWLLFRIKTMIMVEEKTPDIYVLMDIGDDYIFGTELTIDGLPEYTSLEALMKEARRTAGSWPETLFLTSDDPAEELVSKISGKHKINFKTAPYSAFSSIINPVNASFNNYQNSEPISENLYDDEFECALSYIPDTYDPCTCGSGKKFKFCCKSVFNDIVEAMADAEEGHYKKALKWMEKAEKKSGQTPEILCRYAIVYSFIDEEKSYEYLEKCLSVFPGHPRANYIKGLEFKNSGKYKEAIEAYKTALENYPPGDNYHLNEVWNNIGTTYLEMGKYAEAKEAWEKSIEYMPKDKVSRENLIHFIYLNPDAPEKLKKDPPLHLLDPSGGEH